MMIRKGRIVHKWRWQTQGSNWRKIKKKNWSETMKEMNESTKSSMHMMNWYWCSMISIGIFFFRSFLCFCVGRILNRIIALRWTGRGNETMSGCEKCSVYFTWWRARKKPTWRGRSLFFNFNFFLTEMATGARHLVLKQCACQWWRSRWKWRCHGCHIIRLSPFIQNNIFSILIHSFHHRCVSNCHFSVLELYTILEDGYKEGCNEQRW